MRASSSVPANSSTILASAAGASFVGATSNSTNGGITLAISAPSGALVGDVFIAIVSHRGGTGGTITGPGNWTAIAQVNSGTTLAQRILYRVAASADLSVSHSFNFNTGGNVKGAGVVIALRGINDTNTLITFAQQANAANTNIAVPGLTMAAQSAFLLTCASKADDNAHAQISGWTLNTGATASSAGGGAATRNRVSAQYKESIASNPSSATIVTGSTSSVSIGAQMALLVGAEASPSLVCDPGAYQCAGAAAALQEVPQIRSESAQIEVLGRDANFVHASIWTVLNTVGGTASTFADTTAASSTSYRYRVVAINAAGETLSNESQATTFPSNSYPQAVVPDVYEVTGRDVVMLAPIEFVASPGSYGVTGSLADTVNPPFEWEVVDTTGAGTNLYQDTGLDPASGYVYRVVAVNTSGETLSNQSVAYTLSGVFDEEFAALSGAYLAAGSGMQQEFPEPATADAYAVSGAPAALETVREFVSLAEGYESTGRDAGLTADALHVPSVSGTYGVTGAAAMFAREFIGQQAVPVSDLSAGGWTPSSGADLFAMVDDQTDDPPVDSTYITSVNPQDDEAVLMLAVVSEPREGDVTMLVRTRKVV